MKIVLGKENIKDIEAKYTVLELDTFLFNNSLDPVVSYCVIESIPIDQISNADKFKELHINLMHNYRLKNWQFCENALEHLIGKWNGEIDSFYNILSERIQSYKDQTLPDAWNGIINKSVG